MPWDEALVVANLGVMDRTWAEEWIQAGTDCHCGCMFIAHCMDTAFKSQKYSCDNFWPFPLSWVLVSLKA